MNLRSSLTASALLAAAVFLPRESEAQAFTEFRDPLRGVTFYSVQIATDSLTELQHEGSRFSEGDQMTLGLSAFFFDESDTIDDYVLWLRHEGPRRWFTGTKLHPLDMYIDGSVKTPAPLHTLRPDAERAGPFVEKLEFTVHPDELQKILDAGSVRLELRTLLGSLEKTLADDDIAAIERFRERVTAAHDKARSGTTTSP